VLDVFGGSGTTLLASEQLNRICHMMELDEKYIDVIVNRYINYKNSSDDVFLIRDGKKMKYSEVVQM
jgi:DNA modification methylase